MNAKTAACAALLALALGASATHAAPPRPVRKGLKIESVAVAARTTQVMPPFFFQDPRDAAWHLCLYSYALNRVDYMTDPPSQFIDVNLTTGDARRVDCVPGRPVESRTMLHSSGRLYAGSGRPNRLFEYDAATGKGRDLGKITDAFYNETSAIGEDAAGRVLIRTRGGDGAIYDPKTGILKRLAAKDVPLKKAPSAILGIGAAEKKLGMVFDCSGIVPTGRNGGTITVRWKKRDAADWRSATVKGVRVRANSVRLLIALPDGKLFGCTSLYTPMMATDPKTGVSLRAVTMHGPYFTLDPETGEGTILGRMPHKPTALAAFGDTVYMAWGGTLLAYGRTKPWTYTPAEPLGGDAPNPAVAAQQGTLPIGAVQLAIRSQHKKGAPTTLLLPGSNDVLAVGRKRNTDGNGNITWQFVVRRTKVGTDQVIYNRFHTGRPFSGMEKYDLAEHARELVLGPDGCAWLFIDRDLCRIHPADGRIEKALADCEVRGRLLFVGNDLYLYNGGRLFFDVFADIRRIRGVFAE